MPVIEELRIIDERICIHIRCKQFNFVSSSNLKNYMTSLSLLSTNSSSNSLKINTINTVICTKLRFVEESLSKPDQLSKEPTRPTLWPTKFCLIFTKVEKKTFYISFLGLGSRPLPRFLPACSLLSRDQPDQLCHD